MFHDSGRFIFQSGFEQFEFVFNGPNIGVHRRRLHSTPFDSHFCVYQSDQDIILQSLLKFFKDSKFLLFFQIFVCYCLFYSEKQGYYCIFLIKKFVFQAEIMSIWPILEYLQLKSQLRPMKSINFQIIQKSIQSLKKYVYYVNSINF